MKGSILIFISTICLCMMAACVKVERVCGYTKFYCDPYYGNGACGPRITYRCDFICDACSAKEPACRACWECINTDGCLDYRDYRTKSCSRNGPSYDSYQQYYYGAKSCNHVTYSTNYGYTKF